MKTSKKVLIVILGIFIFLICDKIRVSANSTEEVLQSNLNIENLVKYINNIDLTEEAMDNISKKSQSISEDIKDKTSFKDYKVTEIFKIYRNFTSIANDLDLKIDFSIKNGDFTLKDKATGNSIFKGNVSDINNYFKAIKNNTALLTIEVLANADNKDINNIKEEIIDNTIIDKEETLNNKEQIDNDDKNTIENEKEKTSIENNLAASKANNNMILPISILAVTFFVIVISYIKFR